MSVSKHCGLYLFKRQSEIRIQANKYVGCWTLWYDRLGRPSEHQICCSAIGLGNCRDCPYTAQDVMTALEVFYTEILRRPDHAEASAGIREE